MTQVLTDFIRALRATNVRISTSESIDAAAAVDAIGFDDRALLKESLSQVLAKTPEEKQSFADCFERFFFAEDMGGVDALDPPASATDGSADDESAQAGGTGEAGDAGESGEGEGGEGGLATMMAGGGGRAELQMAVANAAREAGVANIRLFTQRGMFMRRILETIGIETLEAAIRDAGDPARAEALTHLRAQLIAGPLSQAARVCEFPSLFR